MFLSFFLDGFTGAFTGANYKVYAGITSTELTALKKEIELKTPIFESKIKHATAPDFNDISSKFTTPVNDGAFAASISGYLVPPLTGMYKFMIGGHFQGMLSLSEEMKSIEKAIEKKTSYNGDTAAYVPFNNLTFQFIRIK